MALELYAAGQGLYMVEMDGRFTGRINNDGLRGRWFFRAASSRAGDADGQGPLRGADGLDVTHVLHDTERLETALCAGRIVD